MSSTKMYPYTTGGADFMRRFECKWLPPKLGFLFCFVFWLDFSCDIAVQMSLLAKVEGLGHGSRISCNALLVHDDHGVWMLLLVLGPDMMRCCAQVTDRGGVNVSMMAMPPPPPPSPPVPPPPAALHNTTGSTRREQLP